MIYILPPWEALAESVALAYAGKKEGLDMFAQKWLRLHALLTRALAASRRSVESKADGLRVGLRAGLRCKLPRRPKPAELIQHFSSMASSTAG